MSVGSAYFWETVSLKVYLNRLLTEWPAKVSKFSIESGTLVILVEIQGLITVSFKLDSQGGVG